MMGESAFEFSVNDYSWQLTVWYSWCKYEYNVTICCEMFDEKWIWKLQDEAGLKLKKKNWNHICAIFEVQIRSEQKDTKTPDYNVDESITDHICKWSY